MSQRRRPASRGPNFLAVALAGGACLVGCAPEDHPDTPRDTGDDLGIPWLGEGRPPIEAPRIPWLSNGDPPIDAPDIPWSSEGVPAMDWPCPPGWRAVEDTGVRFCDPYPPGGPADCSAGEAHLPGRAGCRAPGRPCDDARFPPVDDLSPDTPIRHVASGAPPGGDGSATAPFTTLAAALDRAAPGTEVVLAAGTYAVPGPWPRGVSARGVCPERTRLVPGVGAPLRYVVEVAAGSTRLADLSVGPAALPGVEVRGRATSLTLAGVVLRDLRGPGLAVDGGGLAAVEVLVEGTSEGPGQPATESISVRGGAVAALERATVRRYAGTGVRVAGAASELALRDVLIADPRPDASTRGVEAEDGAALRLERAVVRDAAVAGVVLRDGASGVAEDLSVVDAGRPGLGNGVEVRGGTLVARRVAVDRATRVGVLVAAGARVSATELVVRDGLGPDELGTAVAVQNGGMVDAERAAFLGNVVGWDLRDAGTYGALRDVFVDGSRSESADGATGLTGVRITANAVVQLGRAGVVGCENGVVVGGGRGTALELRDAVVEETGRFGISVESEGYARLERVLLARNAQIALQLFGGRADASHVDVVDPQLGPPDGAFLFGVGRGIVMLAEADLVADHVRIVGAGDVGVTVDGPAELALRDAVIRDAVGLPDGNWGRGISVIGIEGPVDLSLRRVRLAGNRSEALYASGDVDIDAADVVITGTRPASGGAGSVAGRGAGVVLQERVRATLDRVRVDRSKQLGVQLVGAELTLRDAVVRDTRGVAGGATGIVAIEGATLAGRGVAIEGVQGQGVFVFNASGVSLEDVVIRDVAAPACAPRCPRLAPSFGTAVGGVLDSSLRLRRFLVEHADLCGMQLRPGAGVDLIDGLVSHNPIAVCLQTPEFELRPLVQGVRYVDNDQLVRVADFPIPETPERSAALPRPGP